MTFTEKDDAMKTILFGWIIGLMWPLIGEAQTEKGQWTVGTQVGNLSYQNQDESRTISFSITPSAGYFIINGLVIGTGIPVSMSNQKNTNETAFYRRNKSSTIGLAPFIRYFLGEKKLKPYVGLAYSYSKTSYKASSRGLVGFFESEAKGKITAFTPTVGLAYFLSRNLGLTAGLNYNINHQDQEGTSSVPGFPPGTSSYTSDTKSLSLSVGFQLFIGR